MTISVSFYRNFLLLTIVTVCLLILAGGIVRSTGSGMGCPDWPKCFGQYIPPTDVSQLPENYQEVYSGIRQEKNEKLAGYLEIFGFGDLANQLRNDPSILEEERFNPTKTWIEYINRLLGAVVGLLFLLNAFFAFRLKDGNRIFIMLALLNIVLVGFQGWVGSVVVSTNLLGGMITFHMLLALLILAVLIINYWATDPAPEVEVTNTGKLKQLYLVLVMGALLFVVQVALGTQVREAIDVVAKAVGEAGRSQWISQLGITFYVHRSYSLLILVLHGYFAFKILKLIDDRRVIILVRSLMLLLLGEIFTGIIMAYFGVPAFAQPIHLLLATLIFAIDFYLILELRKCLKLRFEAELSPLSN